MRSRFHAKPILIRLLAVCLVLANFVVQGSIPAAPAHGASAPAAFAQAEFQRLWQRTDGPVASGATSRSWLWGPTPGTALSETYAQGLDGQRAVQYFDKARMELNPAVTDVNSPWRVTTGLLVSEMVQGRVQTGDNQFVATRASDEAVAGDGGNSGNPKYSDFTSLLGQKADDHTGDSVTDQIGSGGVITTGGPLGVRVATYVPETGHNIPDVFWSYLNQSGPVQDDVGHVTQARLFDWVYVMGYPVTEPYWADMKIGGAHYAALVQLFQRRTLTYVAAFPEAWRVQMGNVGQHYYQWRYGIAPPTNGQPPQQPVATPVPSVSFPSTGGFVGITGDNFTYAGTPVKLKGTNYWLHNSPFVSTWAEWDGPQALAELEKAHELGVNTVRIGIPFNHFATRDVVWDDDASMGKVSGWIIDEMTQLLQAASVYGMNIPLTIKASQPPS